MLVKSQVKYIQSLSQKKLRDEEDVFVAEGPKIINELLESANVVLQHLYAVDEWINAQRSLPEGKVTAITPSELERISFLHTPNGVLGIFRKPVFPGNDDYRNRVSLMLDTIQDPGNLGTIIRCADWFGIRTVICSRESADVFNPKVVQSTMGSITRVQVVYDDLPSFLQKHREVPVYAATLQGTDLTDMKPLKEGIILIGNESKGIGEDVLALAQHRITIPRRGEAESLNAAVAAGIILSRLA